MAKDEALDNIIQKYKNNIEPLEVVRIVSCDEIKWDCFDCPFRHGESCENIIAEKLIESLLKAEKRSESNFKYFFKDSSFTDDNGCIIKARLPWNLQTDNLTTWVLIKNAEVIDNESQKTSY